MLKDYKSHNIKHLLSTEQGEGGKKDLKENRSVYAKSLEERGQGRRVLKVSFVLQIFKLFLLLILSWLVQKLSKESPE